MQANIFKRSAVAIAIAGAFALGGVAATACCRRAALAAVVPTANPAAPTVAVDARANAWRCPDFSGLVAQHGPAVVNISVTSDNQKVLGQDENDDDARSQAFRRNSASSSITSRCRGRVRRAAWARASSSIARRHRADQRARRRRRRMKCKVKLTDKREFTAEGARQSTRRPTSRC